METRHSRAVLSLVGSICANALQHEPDQKLLRLFRENHDQHAFRALVEKHQGSVLSLARSIVRNEEDAEDVMQAVFLVLARKVKQATQANSLTSWLLGVTYRTAKEAQRQHARRQRLERRVPLDESIPDRNRSAENKAELSDLVALLHLELARLPKKYREPFILCHHEVMSRVEAAKKLGYAVPTLDRRLARARAILSCRIQQATGCDEAIVVSSVLTAHALLDNTRRRPSPKLAEQTVHTALLGASGLAPGSAIKANVLALAHWFLQQNAHRAFRVVVFVCLGLTGAGFAAGYAVTNAHDQGAAHALSGNNQRSDRAVERAAHEVSGQPNQKPRDIIALEKTLRGPITAKVLAAMEKIGGKATLHDAWIDEQNIAHFIADWDSPPFQKEAKVIIHYYIPSGDFNLRTTLWKEDWQEETTVDIDRPIIHRVFGYEIVIKLPQLAEIKGAFHMLGQAYAAQLISKEELTMDISGHWYFEGDKSCPCAIYQTGRMLVLVNEQGAIASGRVMDSNSNIVTLQGAGWQAGLVGELSPDHKQIAWRIGNTWKR